MDLETLQKQVDVDLKIDDTELDLESIRTPQLHNKYLKLFTKYSLQYKKAKDDYDGPVSYTHLTLPTILRV